MSLRTNLIRLSRGTEAQRRAARIASDTYDRSAELGLYQAAADYGLPPDATLAQVAHVYALATVPPEFVDVAAQAAEDGFRVALLDEAALAEMIFTAYRELGAEFGPWPFTEGGETTQAIAEHFADENPEYERQAVIDGVLLGFADHLDAIRGDDDGADDAGAV